jgi:hypothetical protein
VTDAEADRLAARATGFGTGLIAVMLVWLVGNRVFTSLWGAPVGPIVALSSAVVVGALVTLVTSRTLLTTLPQPGSPK